LEGKGKDPFVPVSLCVCGTSERDSEIKRVGDRDRER